MSKKRITIENSFHNTETTVHVSLDEWGDAVLSEWQTKKVWKALCGMVDCCCLTRHSRAEGFDTIEYNQDDCIELRKIQDYS
jgi:hypothetical protein